jgi:hypothetical protein
MGPFGYNPKKNPALDALRNNEVPLLAIPAIAYAEKSKTREVAAEISRRRAALGPRVDAKRLAREAMEQLHALASEVFGTTQRPFVVTFGADVYAAFVPDAMSESELRGFKTSVALQGLKLARAVARKHAGGWRYEMSD